MLVGNFRRGGGSDIGGDRGTVMSKQIHRVVVSRRHLSSNILLSSSAQTRGRTEVPRSRVNGQTDGN